MTLSWGLELINGSYSVRKSIVGPLDEKKYILKFNSLCVQLWVLPYSFTQGTAWVIIIWNRVGPFHLETNDVTLLHTHGLGPWYRNHQRGLSSYGVVRCLRYQAKSVAVQWSPYLEPDGFLGVEILVDYSGNTEIADGAWVLHCVECC